MSQKKTIRKLNKILKQVRSYAAHMESLSDDALSHLTVEFKERLQKGESLDDLLPEAFAAICEADKRILGKFPYDVQVMGGIALHQGYLAEMNTGEGKTLVATMPLYLNALTGRGVLLLTTNAYLVLRDAEEMGQVYRFMGLTVATGVQAKEDEQFSNQDKKAIYNADIVYTTHGSFGFDYLFNNLVSTAEERFMRELYYVVIDEADSVLLDGAQTPLVISGAPRVQSNLYEMADFFVRTLSEGRDYETEDNKVWLTEEGIRYTEQFFRIDNFYGKEYFEINRHVTLALRAHVLFKPEKDYMVSKDQKLQLLDNGSGRAMSGVKLRGGIHQAIEVKERIKVSQENRSMASITYQNLFLLFEKMSGMSGTISDAAEELLNVYGEKVVVIPPNCPLQRKDMPDIYFRDVENQFSAAIMEAVALHSIGQPILIVVTTIAETEVVSQLLLEENIPHNVLNANNAFWEADMIKEAGQMNAVTVATAMAGRGTDIKLGPGVKELGGLAVIGIGRMANTRQERQARGRAGRQGDPGMSRFYVSIEDEVVKQHGPSNMEKYINGQKRISQRRRKKIINTAQKLGEEFTTISRKTAVDYDLVLRKQRLVMYDMRDRLLDGGTLEREKLLQIARKNVEAFVKQRKNLEQSDIYRYILDNISYSIDCEVTPEILKNRKMISEHLLNCVETSLQEQRKRIGSDEMMNDFIRIATLRAIDDAWIEQVDYLQQLQTAVLGRAMAQRNPVYEYQEEALESYQRMQNTIFKNIIRNILLSEVSFDKKQKMQILYP